MITKRLIQAIRDQYALPWSGVHGVSHWGRVYSNGLRLARICGANDNVIKLFAIFHDAGRLNDGSDPDHGVRGAQLAEAFRGTYFDMPDNEFELLITACRRHTAALTHDDLTVQTCFDADRLDLARVGTMPEAKYLCTDTAKAPDTISWATERSRSGHVPDIVTVWSQSPWRN